MTTEQQRSPEPPWMRVARLELGTRERLSDGTYNPRIAEYFQATNFPGGTGADAWCSAFLNWVMREAGIERTRRANARSWLDWGQPLETPVRGCVAVYWRDDPRSSKGHVGLLCEQRIKYDNVLGGNEGNAVAVRPYQVARLIAYRWPPGHPLPA